MLCWGKKSGDVAGKNGGSSPVASARMRANNPLRSSRAGGGNAGGRSAAQAGASSSRTTAEARCRPIDQRMFRHTPTLADLRRDYHESMAELRHTESREAAARAEAAAGARARAGGGVERWNSCLSALDDYDTDAARLAEEELLQHRQQQQPGGRGGGGWAERGRLIQREFDNGANLSGHSLRSSSGGGASSTTNVSPGMSGDGFWNRLRRGRSSGKKSVLAPPERAAAVAVVLPRLPSVDLSLDSDTDSKSDGGNDSEGSSSGGSSTTNSSSSSGSGVDGTDPRKQLVDFTAPPDALVRVHGGHGHPTVVVSPPPLPAVGIPEVMVVRLNDEFYTSQELQQWRALQAPRAGDFLGGESPHDGSTPGGLRPGNSHSHGGVSVSLDYTVWGGTSSSRSQPEFQMVGYNPGGTSHTIDNSGATVFGAGSRRQLIRVVQPHQGGAAAATTATAPPSPQHHR